MLSLRHESLTIPTYEMGPEDPFPPLNFGGFPGRRKKPFPYSMQDDIDIATMPFNRLREYRAIVLSNGLLEATILPEMNGRLYSLRDLGSGRELFYRNHVVKPALVALRGAWISGGLEFNFPTRGHTVSTVSPVAFRTEQTSGEVAVTIGDIDRSTRQRWTVRMSLKENRAALDLKVSLHNPNRWRERLYYWENSAVPATDDMRFVCRCDWTVGETSLPFPERNGKDVSRYPNNPNPCDHFGYRSHADFFGAHYADSRSGTYHVAPRIEAAGQKYFTWGTNEDNKIWEGYLTDSDGQYVEIQAGILESQWFSGWLQPQETVSAEGSWFGVADCSELIWANKRLGVGVEREGDKLALDLHSIDLRETLAASVRMGENLTDYPVEARPGQVRKLLLDNSPFELELRDSRGRLLLAEHWTDESRSGLDANRPLTPPIQWSMKGRGNTSRAKAETAIKEHSWNTADKLLETEAFAEVDKLCLLAERNLKAANWEKAATTAMQALNLEPENTFAHNCAMGAALAQMRRGETNAHYQAWDHAMVIRRDPRFAKNALLTLAATSILKKRYLDARDFLDSLLRLQPENLIAHLYRETLSPYLGESGGEDRQHPDILLFRNSTHFQHRLELALALWRVGWGQEALDFLPLAEKHVISLLLHAHCASQAGDAEQCRQFAAQANNLPATGVVPSRFEEYELLKFGEEVLETAPAFAYLQGIWFAEYAETEAASHCWEKTLASSPSSELEKLCHSCLAEAKEFQSRLAGGDARQPLKKAAEKHLRKALAAAPGERRLILRLDDLLREQQDCSEREKLWETIPPELRKRGDCTFRIARLAVDLGQGAEAAAMLLEQNFSVYEGGTGIRRLYVDAELVAALRAIRENHWEKAKAHCKGIFAYPENLGAASYLGEHSRLARFLLGLIAGHEGCPEDAEKWWRDVLARTAGGTTYTVGDEDGLAKLRADERLALQLAQSRLGLVANTGKPSSQSAKTPEQAIHLLTTVILTQDPQGEKLAEQLLGKFPCSCLLRILAGLVQIHPLKTN